MSKLKISNIKVSVKVSAKERMLRWFNKSETAKSTKDCGSFFVYRKNGFVFCIYYTGHVNLTGIKKIECIEEGITILKSIPGILSIKKITVDNITCTGKLHKSVYKWNRSFADYLNDLTIIENFDKVQYSPQTFPGAFLKKHGIGTVVFFATGKFNVVGCKSCDSLMQLVGLFLDSLKQIK